MVDKKITKTKINFMSGGVPCTGYLFMPEVTSSIPCVVLGHGFTGTQDRLEGTAERFASEGMAALTFDYRGFGESGGAPRQVVSIKGQIEDFKNAVLFARRQSNINPDKVALWGSSLGGGHVISVAGNDPRIAAVVAQVPFNGFPKKVEGRSDKDTKLLLSVMLKDAIRGLLHQPPIYIKAVGNTGELAVMASPQAQKTIDAMQSSQWQNKVSPRSLLEMMFYKPGKVAARIKVPVLICIGTLDRETQGDMTKQLATGPKAELREYPVAHFDFYRPDIRAQVISDQIAFLKRSLL